MIVLFFSCDECGEEREYNLREFSALAYQPLPKGWVWIHDKGYCEYCCRYQGISLGLI